MVFFFFLKIKKKKKKKKKKKIETFLRMNLYTLKTKRNSCNEISKIYAPLNKEEKEKIYIYINDGLNYILKDYQIKENKKKKKRWE